MSKNINRSRDFNDNEPDVIDAVTDKVKDAGRTIRNFSDETQKKVIDLSDAAVQRIRTKPFSTSALVFISGVVLGALMRR